RQRQSDDIRKMWFGFEPDPSPKPKRERISKGSPATSVTVADQTVLNVAFGSRSGSIIKGLFDAHPYTITHVLERPKADGSPDWSEAVNSFLWRLAFYTQDECQLDRLFRMSKLYSETHWESKWERLGEAAINAAIDGLENTYYWPNIVPDFSEATCEFRPEDIPHQPAPAPQSVPTDDLDTTALAAQQAAKATERQEQQANRFQILRRSQVQNIPKPNWLVRNHIREQS